MPVNFQSIKVGHAYSRNELAKAWGYKSFHAIARGIVTPQNNNKVIIFITEEKQSSSRQYKDKLDGNILKTEGPDDHFAEDRIFHASTSGDEIHLLHRLRHHTDFIYLGKMKLLEIDRRSNVPSYFEYQVG